MQSAEVKEALDGIAAQVKGKFNELQAEVRDLEQKVAARHGGWGDASSDTDDGLAKHIQADEGFKMLASGRIKSTQLVLPPGALHTKTAMTSTTTSAVLDADRRPTFVLKPQRKLTIRDLLPTIRTDRGSIEYVRELSSTNAAAIVDEAALKPQSTATFELVTATVRTIATWAHASKQILDDQNQLALFLENRLRYNVQFAEEVQLLNGSGSGTNLLGLFTAATAFAAPVVITSPTPIDTIRLAIGQLENANYDASAVVLHPDDWTTIELLKATDENYLKSNPETANARTLWGRPVVITTAMGVGDFLVGDFPAAATLYDRQDPTLDIATQDQDDFVRNLIKLRVEERVSLAVQLPGALVAGSFA